MKRLVLAVLVAALIVSGLAACGASPPRPGRPETQIPPWSILPPESSRTPDGAKPAAPPKGLYAVPEGKHIDAAGLLLIERFEGFGSCPYWDAYGRVWTRGFGETEGIHGNSPCISVAQGTANLKRLIETRYEWGVRGIGVSFNQNQWDALCSFVWNLGAGIFQGTSIGAEFRAHNFQGGTNSMLQYVHAGGQVLQGLVTRRRAEVALFWKPVAKPPTPHQRLWAAYRTRSAIAAKLHAHKCFTVHGKNAFHGCPALGKEWRAIQAAIKKLHAAGVY